MEDGDRRRKGAEEEEGVEGGGQKSVETEEGVEGREVKG